MAGQAPMMNFDDRRSHRRTAVDWPAMVITPEGCIGGEVKNISPTGAFIHCFTEPDQQKTLRLVVRDPLRKKLLLITAELAWSNIENCDDLSSCGIGVQFTKIFSDDHLFDDCVTSEHLQMLA
jgi:hypothetical protein